jgi:hypothetical protein
MERQVSSIDTALLLGGVLTARQFFRGDQEMVGSQPESMKIWILSGCEAGILALSHGWKPEAVFSRRCGTATVNTRFSTCWQLAHPTPDYRALVVGLET